MLGVWKHRETATYRLRGNFCRDRFCPACARQRRIRIHKVLAGAFDKLTADHPGQKLLLVTLTIRHRDVTLNQSLDHIRQSWRALSQDPWWKAIATSGLWAIEIKYNASRQEWHPHIHAIVLADWISHSKLQDKWHAITGDSYIVDVRAVQSNPQATTQHAAAMYVAKYISKPGTLRRMDPHAAAELVCSIKFKRLYSTWGGLRSIIGAVKAAYEDQYHALDWLYVAPLVQVVLQALRGDAEASKAVAALGLDQVLPQMPSMRLLPGGSRPPMPGAPGP